jgi:phage-related protein (TIGR01555 family)
MVDTFKSPRSKSIVRVARSATSADTKARERAARDATKARKNGSTLDSFVNFAHNLGVGADNAMSSSSYGFNPISRNRVQLEWIHRGSWLGGVVVDSVADDMTRAGIEHLGTMKPDDMEALDEAAVTFGIWNALNDTIKWARLYGGGIAVMLIDGQDPETPFRLQTIRKGQFRGLLSLDRWMVEPSLMDLVTEYGPNLGLPKYYRVTAQAPALSGVKIHHTRCVRLEGIKLPYWQRIMENLWGLSVIERLYDRMIAFDSATTGAAQLVYKSYLRTLKIKDMREVVAAGGDSLVALTRYVDMMRRFQGIEGMTVIDAEDDFTADAHSAFGGLSDALAQFGQQLSGASGIPLVRLFGQSPAGFSTGETDLRNYYDTVKQQQEKELKVPVSIIYRALAASEGIALPEGYRQNFRSLWQLKDEEKATIAQLDATSILNAEEKGTIDRATALKELRQSSQVTGRFSNITDEMIADSEGEMAPEASELVGKAEMEEGRGKEATAKAEDPNAKSADKKTKTTKDAAKSQAAGILYCSGDNVLLLKRVGHEAPWWDLPGGGVEAGETPAATATRESEEETGHKPGTMIQMVTDNSGPCSYTTFFCASEEFEPVLNAEHSEFKWVNIDAALGMPLHPGVRKLLEKGI